MMDFEVIEHQSQNVVYGLCDISESWFAGASVEAGNEPKRYREAVDIYCSAAEKLATEIKDLEDDIKKLVINVAAGTMMDMSEYFDYEKEEDTDHIMSPQQVKHEELRLGGDVIQRFVAQHVEYLKENFDPETGTIL